MKFLALRSRGSKTSESVGDKGIKFIEDSGAAMREGVEVMLNKGTSLYHKAKEALDRSQRSLEFPRPTTSLQNLGPNPHDIETAISFRPETDPTSTRW